MSALKILDVLEKYPVMCRQDELVILRLLYQVVGQSSRMRGVDTGDYVVKNQQVEAGVPSPVPMSQRKEDSDSESVQVSLAVERPGIFVGFVVEVAFHIDAARERVTKLQPHLPGACLAGVGFVVQGVVDIVDFLTHLAEDLDEDLLPGRL